MTYWKKLRSGGQPGATIVNAGHRQVVDQATCSGEDQAAEAKPLTEQPMSEGQIPRMAIFTVLKKSEVKAK
jgi:hypothetical protein